MELFEKTLTEALHSLEKGETSAEALTRVCLQRIQETEPSVHALLGRQDDAALAAARALDAHGYDASKPLWGIPVTVKDALATKGLATTAGSRILENFVPPYNAFVIDRLEAAGAIILGKNNMDEFAMGSTCEHSAYQTTCNPRDLSCVPGGSSGGSAASVTAGQCFASLGTDTGGSIRQPAALCGCVGLKPTYGRVSRYGLLAYGSSLDQIGPLTRSVEDAARMLSVIAGYDERDSTSSPDHDHDDFLADLNRQDLSGLRIGLPKEFFDLEGLDPQVAEVCRATVAKAEALGAKTIAVSMPHLPYSIAAYYIIASAEASSNLARYDGVRYGHRTDAPADLNDLYVRSRTEGFGEEVQRRILLGTYVLSSGYYDAYYRKAAQVRRLIREDYEKALAQCDVLLAPVSPIVAWKLGGFADPLQMYQMDIFTLSLNLAGLPGLSIPVGTADNMPVGMQIIGRAFDERTILGAGNLLCKNMGVAKV